jgi:hypothetical protein
VSKDDKSDAFDTEDIVDGDYMVSGDTVAQIVISLLHLVIAFIGVEKARSLLTQIGVQQANAVADQAEKAKFGN